MSIYIHSTFTVNDNYHAYYRALYCWVPLQFQVTKSSPLNFGISKTRMKRVNDVNK